jgi:DNA-binding CsgD family transcriptional regulator
VAASPRGEVLTDSFADPACVSLVRLVDRALGIALAIEGATTAVPGRFRYDTCAALRLGPAVSSWRSTLALALPAEARGEACELVAEEVELARATGLARPYGVALRAAGILEGGEGGIERLAESVSVLEPSEARLEHARSLVGLGAAVRRRGRRAEARAPLTTGMDIAHRCGADCLVDRAQEELHAAGSRPRRITSTGTDALTASERRVALLAAEGRANAEIAQELYISLKTVDTHLSHAYAKLGISGQGARKRLAATIGSDTESAT